MSLAKIKTISSKNFLALLFIAAICLWVIAALAPASVSATHTTCAAGTAKAGQPIPHSNARQAEAFCTGTISSQEAAAAAPLAVDCTGDQLTSSNCGIVRYVTIIIRVLSVSVGIVVLIMVAWGGFQYASSRDNPQQTADAKDHIRNALIALLLYIFSVALINYLVPGGVF